MKSIQLQRYIRWFFIAIILLLLIVLFPYYKSVISFIGSIFLPFIIASFIAYLLHPLVVWIYDQHIHKGIAILLIYFLFVSSTSYGIYLLYPRIIDQLAELNDQLPAYIQMYEQFIRNIDDSAARFPEPFHTSIDQLISKIQLSVEQSIRNTIGGLTKVLNFVFVLMLIPVLVFYFLKDFTMFKHSIRKLIPVKHRETAQKMAESIDDRLGKYIRGQFIVSLFVTITSFIAYKWIGIQFALLLAIVMGFANLIPYFGPIIGAVPAVVITLTTSAHLVWFVIGSVIFIQLIEGNLLSPYILGKSVQMHPVVIIFVLVVGGKLFGIIGMMLAVPIITIILATIDHMKTLWKPVND